MFELYETVKIKKHNITGVIVDICHNDNKPTIYTVESNVENTDNSLTGYDYPGEYPLYDCQENEIEKITN